MRIHSGIIYTTWVTTGASEWASIFQWLFLSLFSLPSVFCILTSIHGIVLPVCLSMWMFTCTYVHFSTTCYLYRWRSMKGWGWALVHTYHFMSSRNSILRMCYTLSWFIDLFILCTVVLVYCHFIFTIECANKNGKLYKNCRFYLGMNRQQRGVNKSI